MRNSGDSTDGEESAFPVQRPAPESLVIDGRFQLGRFDLPPRIINPLDARFPPTLPWFRAAKRFRLKEWQHFIVATPEFFLTLALFDAKWMGLGQIVLYDRKSGQLIIHEKRFAGPQIKLPSSHWNADTKIRRGSFFIHIANRLEEGFHQVTFGAGASEEGPSLTGEIRCLESMDRHSPLAACLPLPNGGAMYTHKAAVPAEGKISVGDRPMLCSPGNSYALTDIHQGYYPNPMKWFWATAAGYDRKGRLVGFNLTRNQVQDRNRYNENGIWIDGQLHPLPDVRFEIDRDHPGETPWRIEDDEGRVDLTFRPEGIRKVDINLGLFRSRYRGPFGSFEGRVGLADGSYWTLENQFGMCEDFLLRA